MTKDLALLVGPDQPWQTTEEFLAALDENLPAASPDGRLTCTWVVAELRAASEEACGSTP